MLFSYVLLIKIMFPITPIIAMYMTYTVCHLYTGSSHEAFISGGTLVSL